MSISNFLWEPVGVVFLIALVFLLWDKRKFWKDPLFITFFISFIFLPAWRIYINASSGRYFAVMALPVLLVIFHFLWRVPLPKVIRGILIAGAIFACFCRDMRGNPYEKDMISLYQKLGNDAKKYSKVSVLSFTSQAGRESFYSGVKASSVDREIPRQEILNNLRGNLDFFNGISDAVYILISNNTKEKSFAEDFCKLMPDSRVELFGRSFIDRSRKKEVLLFKYLPQNVSLPDVSHFKLLENGDFAQFYSKENAEKKHNYLARRAPRFGSEKPLLPEKYAIGHSLTAFSNSVAGVKMLQNKNVLHLEANGSYLFVITPQIDMRSVRYFSFDMKVNRPSSLQINRNVQGKGLFPFFTVELPSGEEKRYVLRLENSGGAGEVYFWLNDGDIELSNLKIK